MSRDDQTGIDFDKIRDRELTKYLNEKYNSKQPPYDEEDDNDEEDQAR